MQVIDLTYPVCPQMPVYPGTDQPILSTGCTIEKDGFFEKKITLFSHTGTHVDAPAHLIKGSKTLDQFPVSHFLGKGILFDISDCNESTIDVDKIKSLSGTIEKTDFLLVRTGWNRYWGYPEYFSNYPVFSPDAAKWLSQQDLKGIGLDTISADRPASRNYKIHKTFLKQNIIIIENLNNLERLNKIDFLFSCFPIKFEDADGSPVRAVALLNDFSK